MTERVTIVGSYLSPYVRKVLVFLHEKGIDYEIDPIVPFLGDDRFGELSPLRRVPVLIDGDVVLSDSSVICQYLEDAHPEPALFPKSVADRARARWLEEFADTRMGDVFIWRLFHELAIKPFVLGQETDRAVVTRTLAEDVPEVMDYLEREAPDTGHFFGALSVADVSVATFFRNAAFARLVPDAARWPRISALVERTLARDSFLRLRPFEERMIRTPVAQHRAVLAEMGAPLTAGTFGTSTPRRGALSV